MSTSTRSCGLAALGVENHGRQGLPDFLTPRLSALGRAAPSGNHARRTGGPPDRGPLGRRLGGQSTRKRGLFVHVTIVLAKLRAIERVRSRQARYTVRRDRRTGLRGEAARRAARWEAALNPLQSSSEPPSGSFRLPMGARTTWAQTTYWQLLFCAEGALHEVKPAAGGLHLTSPGRGCCCRLFSWSCQSTRVAVKAPTTCVPRRLSHWVPRL